MRHNFPTWLPRPQKLMMLRVCCPLSLPGSSRARDPVYWNPHVEYEFFPIQEFVSRFFKNFLKSLFAFATLLAWGFVPAKDPWGAPSFRRSLAKRWDQAFDCSFAASTSGGLFELTAILRLMAES